MSNAPDLLIDSNRGIYVPQSFATMYDFRLWGFDDLDEDIALLMKGPDDEFYWEAWETVLNNAKRTDDNGMVWRLNQDEHGDLWDVPDDFQYDDD